MENFIRLYENALTDEFCDHIVDSFEKDPYKKAGVNLYGTTSNKKTTDLIFDHPSHHVSEIWLNFDKVITETLDKYVNRYMTEFSRCFAGNTKHMSNTGYKIMKYDALVGNFNEHIDVNGLNSCHRFISCLFYLNDVEVGGETKFHYQNVSVSPKKGRLLIFPANYTHLHQGCVAATDKYVTNTFITYAG